MEGSRVEYGVAADKQRLVGSCRPYHHPSAGSLSAGALLESVEIRGATLSPVPLALMGLPLTGLDPSYRRPCVYSQPTLPHAILHVGRTETVDTPTPSCLKNGSKRLPLVPRHATSVNPPERAKVSVMQEPDPRQRTKLLKIGMRQCRYIVSDDPRSALCCGALTREGSSWCDWHRRLVYVPAQPVKIRRDALAS